MAELEDIVKSEIANVYGYHRLKTMFARLYFITPFIFFPGMAYWLGSWWILFGIVFYFGGAFYKDNKWIFFVVGIAWVVYSLMYGFKGLATHFFLATIFGWYVFSLASKYKDKAVASRAEFIDRVGDEGVELYLKGDRL